MLHIGTRASGRRKQRTPLGIVVLVHIALLSEPHARWQADSVFMHPDAFALVTLFSLLLIHRLCSDYVPIVTTQLLTGGTVSHFVPSLLDYKV